MEWSAKWPKENPKDLARYVVPDWAEQAANLQFEFNHHDALATHVGRRKIVESIYDNLRQRVPGIQYAREDFALEENVQVIRHPEEILHRVRPKGTCLDLSLLFCGLCLANELLPTLIVLRGHAFVAVSLNFILRNDGPGSWKAYGQERLYIERSQGMLRYEGDGHIAFLREHIIQGDYLPVECTGFAHTERLDDTMPEGKDRIDGFLSFEKAVRAGKEQLYLDQRPFQYALDICYLQNKAGIKPYQAGVETMEIEVAKLASVIVGVLVPYLKMGAEKMAGKIGDEAGQKSTILASTVWDKVKAAFSSDAKCKRAIESFEKQPKDEDNRRRMITYLEDKLKEDSQLAKDLDNLLRTSRTSDGKELIQIIADKVGYVNAPGARLKGRAIMAGYINRPIAGPSSPKKPKKPKSLSDS
jgi:hypothetical protein